ncbi:MAG: division/cell wall cluster transcriptional repressor MraZ [Pseudomonadota bacterium]
MYSGVQFINMDAKGRLAVPARLREPLDADCGGRLVVTIDTQSSCLVVYPYPEWERVAQDIQGLPTLKPAVKRFQRLVLGYATELDLDANGRILLPAPLREYARLEKRLVMVGQGNKLELWSETLWSVECGQALEDSTAGGEPPEELMTLRL